MFLIRNILKTSVIRVFEAFAGIGAQHKAITNIDPEKKYFKVVKTSEWDARAIIAYAQIHHHKEFVKKLIEIKRWKDEKINNYLSNRVFSLDSKNTCKILRKDKMFKLYLVTANLVNKNFPDIRRVSGRELKNIDLLTYSFPCQGLSNANMGRSKGIKKNSNSTSNLIWEIKRLLDDAYHHSKSLPKYLLMENVMALIQKKHKKDFDRWVNILKKMGYRTFPMKLNGLDFNSVQARKRLFAISILNYDQKISNDDFESAFISTYGNRLMIEGRKEKYLEIFKKNTNDEIQAAIPNKTPSRIFMEKENRKLLSHRWKNELNKFTFKTLTTKQDRHPNIGMIKLKSSIEGKLNYRFITTREAYKIMGFTKNDFNNVKKLNNIFTKESLYRQAGNSIIVSILEAIFRYVKNFEKEKHE